MCQLRISSCNFLLGIINSQLWNDTSLVNLVGKWCNKHKHCGVGLFIVNTTSREKAIIICLERSVEGFPTSLSAVDLAFGNGRSIIFWRDKWLRDKAFVNLVIQPVDALKF